MGNTYSIYYTYKCLGGAKIQSSVATHTACVGTPRQGKTSKVEYIINGVHYVDVDLQEVIEAATANIANSDEPQSFTIEEVKNEEAMEQSIAIEETPGDFDLIPNPASQSVSISYNLPNENSSILYYQVYTLQVKIIQEGNIQNPSTTGIIEMDLNSFDNGIYLVNLKSDNHNISKKLVVNK